MSDDILASMPSAPSLKEGAACAHPHKVMRPMGSQGRSGLYCLDCGWRIWKHRGRWLWGYERLAIPQMNELRASLHLPALGQPDA